MDLRIDGRRALVMGASSGLGQAIARSLISEGAKVAICGRDERKLKQAASEMNAALAVSCDLTQEGAAKKLVQTVLSQFDGIDILVCNTGGPPTGSFSEITSEQWQVGLQTRISIPSN